MIYEFKNLEVKNSGIVYSSTFEQIKKLYEVDPEQAGELAIAAIELVLTGDISSDDVMINLCLEPMKVIRANDEIKYHKKVDATRQKKIEKDKLDMIAELHLQGLKQKQIGERLGISQQIVSHRLSLIKANYPELLQINNTVQKTEVFVKNQFTNNTNDTKDEGFCTFVNTKVTNDTKEEVFCNVCNTNDTNNTNKPEICTESLFVTSDEDPQELSFKPGFVF